MALLVLIIGLAFAFFGLAIIMFDNAEGAFVGLVLIIFGSIIIAISFNAGGEILRTLMHTQR